MGLKNGKQDGGYNISLGTIWGLLYGGFLVCTVRGLGFKFWELRVWGLVTAPLSATYYRNLV